MCSTPIPVAEPTLSSRAMLCDLSISQWSAATYDHEVSKEVAANHGAQASVGRYRKILLPKEALADIRQIAGEARRDHNFMTLPWDDVGYRLLPAAMYMEHVEKLRQHQCRFNEAVDAFVNQFNGLVALYKSQLGSLFRSEDYPNTEELRGKFGLETKVMPLPDAGDFRVSMGNEERDRIKRQITASVEASLTLASRELWQRTYDAVSHMAERLQSYKAEEGGTTRLHASIVTNLMKLVEVMPKLNIARDSELERLTEEIRSRLLVNPDTLRKSEPVRTETARAAAQIAARMAGYLGAQPEMALVMSAA